MMRVMSLLLYPLLLVNVMKTHNYYRLRKIVFTDEIAQEQVELEREFPFPLVTGLHRSGSDFLEDVEVSLSTVKQAIQLVIS